MATTKAPSSWRSLYPTRLAKNWTQDADGAQREKVNEAASLQSVAAAFNHVAAKSQKVRFSKLVPKANVTTETLDPLFRWFQPDTFDNSREYVVRIVTGPRLENVSNDAAYAFRLSGGITENTPRSNVFMNVSSENGYLGCWCDELPSNEANPTGAFLSDGISTAANYRVHSIVVQDREIGTLDDASNHCLMHPLYARPGQPILADGLEEMRNKIHRLRTTQLPRVAQWSAIGAGSIVMSGDSDGMNRVNLFDTTSNERTATSPGPMFYAFVSGVGREDINIGQMVPIFCSVLGECISNANTNICFEGPAHLVGNKTNVLLTNVFGWHNATTPIYGNSLADENKADVNRNKLDIFVENVGCGGWANIYGITAWTNNPMSVF